MSVLHLIAIVLLGIALVCAAAPTTLFGAGAVVWLIAGLFTEALEVVPSVPIVINKR